MQLKIQMLSPLMLAAIAALPVKAQARDGQVGELAEMCLLDSDGSRRAKISLDHLFVQVLTAALPDRFSVVQDQEDCEDERDNNCNGEVNEGCVDPGFRWDAGADCDACMAERCDDIRNCDGDERCDDATACIVEEKCLGNFLGPLSCLCGPGVSISECQSVSEGKFLGPCADEILKIPNNPLGSWRPHRFPFADRFVCMGRFCMNECSELFYDI